MIRPGMLLQGQYKIIRQIGGGGFGKVFEVDDNGTIKVLKILSLERFHNPTIKLKAIALFQREAELLARLKHPGIPRVEPNSSFTWSDSNGEALHCIVMEKIPGSNLQQWLQARGNQPLTTEQAREWLIQLVEILHELHQHQYLHRDIKLSNIMLKPDGQLVLIDFGAVREVTTTYLEKQQGKQTGTVLVSPGFTPPEQAEGYAVPQSDFFALGRTFICLLTGKSPLDFPKNSETGELIWRDDLTNVSPELADLIDRLIAPFSGQRPQNCQEILNYLKGNQQNSQLSKYRKDTIPGTGLGATYLALKRLLQNTFTLQSKSDERVADKQKTTQNKLSKKRSFQLLLAALLVLSGGGINLWKFSPDIAFNLNNWGVAKYRQKSFEVAKIYYQLALFFDPKIPEADYNLGLLYEEENKFDQARAAYKISVQKGYDRAYNNLARLQILNKEYITAVGLLQEGLPFAYDKKAKYTMLKNLGWAYLELGNYQEAKNYLEKAIHIKSDRASAYCLQAKVLEKQQNKQGAFFAWRNCLKYGNTAGTPEEKQWVNEAAKNIN
ncbi:protein kinase [Tolypothrix campylonemoides VB511288]|nr:protein kinase [Tolypothrix campylonemoides VB511288]